MTITKLELTKRERAPHEEVFLWEDGEPEAFGSKPLELRPLSVAPGDALDAFASEASPAPEVSFASEVSFAPEVSLAPEVTVIREVSARPIRSSVPSKKKSRVHPVALTSLGIATAVFALLLVERSTERLLAPVPAVEPPALNNEVGKSMPAPVPAESPPQVVSVPVTPSAPPPAPEIDAPPPKTLVPVTPRTEAPRPAASKPPVNREPSSTARVAPPLSPPLSQTLSQTPPEVVDVPAPPPIVPAAPPVAELPPVPSPAPSAAPPPPPAAPARAAASATESNTRGIENTLARYRTAFSTLDAAAAVKVWPTVNERNLARAFERLQEQEVSFDGCKIDLNNDSRAEATCKGKARYVPRVGSREPRVDVRQWRFSLVKVRDEWLIGAVEAR